MLNESSNKFVEAFNRPGVMRPSISWIAGKLRSRYETNTHTITMHKGDIDEMTFLSLLGSPLLAVDTETGGLSPVDAKLHLVQIADIHGNVHIIQNPGPHSKMVKQLMFKEDNLKVVHWMKFDVMFLIKGLTTPLKVSKSWEGDYLRAAHEAANEKEYGLDKFVCTKTIMKLLVPGKKASLKDAVKWFLYNDLDKEVEHGNWDAETLSERQVEYAAHDVLVLLPLLAEQLNRYSKLNWDAKQGMEIIGNRVRNALCSAALLELNGFTDFLVHGYDNRRCKSPLLRRAEIQDELDDTRNDGDSSGPEADSSSS